jgi:tRNA(fMet)-specific endonuclease VapC
MPDTLVDATIIIDATNKHAKALRYLEKLLLGGNAFTHAQVAAEVISGTRDSREQSPLVKFLRQFKVVHPNENDSQSALHYLSRFHLSNDLGFGDCLIGSTALRLALPVATINVRDFRLFPGLKVIKPY